MALCKDDITTHLKKFNYNTIYPPRTGASPLEVLAKRDGTLTSWGYLDDVIQSNVPLPEIAEEQNPLDIEGKITSKHDYDAGITILGSLIAAVGGNLGIKAAYKGARQFTFNYRQVIRIFVKPVQLDKYITQGAIVPGLLTTTELLQTDKLFVFTAVIKARKIVVEAEKESGGSLAVEVPIVKEIVGANIKVSTEGGANTKIAYEGQIPAGFGFKAVQIDYNKGKFLMKPVEEGTVVAEGAIDGGGQDEPDRTYKVFVFDEDFVRLP